MIPTSTFIQARATLTHFRTTQVKIIERTSGSMVEMIKSFVSRTQKQWWENSLLVAVVLQPLVKLAITRIQLHLDKQEYHWRCIRLSMLSRKKNRSASHISNVLLKLANSCMVYRDHTCCFQTISSHRFLYSNNTIVSQKDLYLLLKD